MIRKIIILNFDQATKISGYSLFDNKELVAYGKLEVDKKEKNIIERMKQMISLIKLKINEHKPDFIVFEDCQFQKSYKTYQELSQMQGVLMNVLFELNIGFEIVSPSTWRSYSKIKGRKRVEQKFNTQIFVKDKYGIEVSEDIADAIGIGVFSSNKVKFK